MLKKTILAVLCAATLTLGLGSTDSDAAHSKRYGHGFGKPDSNGYVPEYYPYTVGTCYDGILGRTHYYTDFRAYYGPHVMWIEYDRCEMKRLGATKAGWDRLVAHERAHSRGFAHHEGHPSYNPAHNPSVHVH